MTNTENTFEQIKKIKMTETEKSVLSNNVTLFMEQNPVQIPSPIQKVSFNQPSPYASRFGFFTMSKAVAFVLIGMIIGGGGMSYAAAGTLPGDFLYPTKVNFNEEVVAVLKATPEAKIEYEQARVETRLAEADTLVSTGKMNLAKQVAVEKTIDTHLAKLNTRVSRLPEEKRKAVAEAVHVRLAARIEKERMLVRNPEFARPLPTATTTTETSIEQSATTAKPVPITTESISTGTATNTSIQTPPPATSATVETQADLVLIAERNIALAGIKAAELAKMSVPNENMRIKLNERVRTIKQIIINAKEEQTAHQYADAIILAKKALTLTAASKAQIEEAIKEQATIANEGAI